MKLLNKTPQIGEPKIISTHPPPSDEDAVTPLEEAQIEAVEMDFGRGFGGKSLLVTSGITLKKLSEMSTK